MVIDRDMQIFVADFATLPGCCGASALASASTRGNLALFFHVDMSELTWPDVHNSGYDVLTGNQNHVTVSGFRGPRLRIRSSELSRAQHRSMRLPPLLPQPQDLIDSTGTGAMRTILRSLCGLQDQRFLPYTNALATCMRSLVTPPSSRQHAGLASPPVQYDVRVNVYPQG